MRSKIGVRDTSGLRGGLRGGDDGCLRASGDLEEGAVEPTAMSLSFLACLALTPAVSNPCVTRGENTPTKRRYTPSSLPSKSCSGEVGIDGKG